MSDPPPTPSQPSPRPLDAHDSAPASHDEPPAPAPAPAPTPALAAPPAVLPQVAVTFLVISGGRRTLDLDPAAPVARVKELVWNAWPAEWPDERPPAPAFLRILYLGRMLPDDETLSSLGLRPGTPPTIMHVSVRPFAPPPAAADDGGAGKPPPAPDAPDGAQAGPCCGCVVS